MSRLPYLASVASLMLLGAKPQNELFSKYRSVEAYEIRPGIIAMPRYAEDGQICEIGLERLHYSPELIRLESSLSRKEIANIFDELVPNDERGPQPENPLERILGGGISGTNVVSAEQFQNVSIYIYGTASAGGKAAATVNEVAATLKWRDRKCP